MSLTMGIGPLSRRAGAGELNGAFEGPAHLLWFHAVPKRVRATFGGETIVDTEAAHLLHETRLLPVYYVPRDDVRFDLLEPTDHSTHCPFKGDARYWSVVVGDAVADNAVWGYDTAINGCPDLSDFVALYFERMDRWFEEDEEIVGHPRDPFHRVDVRASSRTVTYLVDGEEVARSERPVLLFETGLPVRYYLPAEDFTAAMEPTSTTTICPYKGTAQYWTLRGNGDPIQDLVWSYSQPAGDAHGVAGLRCLPQEHDRVELQVSTNP